MLTASVKTTRTRIMGILCVILAVIIGIVLFFGGERSENAAESVSRRVADNSERREYLALKGVETAAEPCRAEEVLLPEDDPLFDEYCEMQKEAGYDIKKYLGKTAMMYIYPVEGSEETFATLFIVDGKIVAADVSDRLGKNQKAVDGKGNMG